MKKGRKGITLDDLPAHARKLVEKQLWEESHRGQPAAQEPASAALGASGEPDSPKGRKRGKKRREMNATEREFLAYLRREYPDADEIDYEKHTIRWGEGASLLSYTPDFVVRYTNREVHKWNRLLFFEVKGAHAWKQDIVKFKAAVTHFDYLEFQLWEKDGAGRWHNTI